MTEKIVDEIYVTQFNGNIFARLLRNLRLRIFLAKRFKKLKNSNAENILETANMREIFLNFIDIQQDNENICKHIECYNLCNGIITNTIDATELSIMIRIMDVATNDTWKNTLRKAFSMRHKNTRRMIEKLRDESLIEIECDSIYHKFMQSIVQKKGTVKNLLINEFEYEEFLKEWRNI